MWRCRNLAMAVAVLGAGLALSACSGADEANEPSGECLDAMEMAAAETNVEAADPLIGDTLSACSSADEWLAALEEHPGAMGLTARAEIGNMDLEVVCWGNEGTPVCQDAIDTDRIETAN
jgi:hypothetical protein